MNRLERTLDGLPLKGRSARVAAIAVAAAPLYPYVREIGQKAVTAYREKTLWEIKVESSDSCFYPLLERVADEIPESEQRRLGVRTLRAEGDQSTAVGKANFYFDGAENPVPLMIKGSKVYVNLMSPSEKDSAGFADFSPIKRRTLVFTVRSLKARQAVKDFIDEIAVKTYSRNPGIFYLDNYSDWSRRGDIPHRTIDSVILPNGTVDDIVKDMDTFLKSKDDYDALGMPWHRGYLFHGPPGTGKTSLAKALAQHFCLDLHFMSLSDMKSDTSIINIVSELRGRSILLLEDVDVVRATKVRDDASTKGASLSGLLNALDGVSTPDGLIVIMTTNDLDSIDPALIRPGRADVIEKLGFIDQPQLDAIVKRFAPEVSGKVVLGGDKITPSMVVEVIKRHRNDPESIAVGINALGQG